MQSLSVFSIVIAEIPFKCSVRFKDCIDWFSHYITREPAINDVSITVSDALLQSYCEENDLDKWSAMDEYHLLHYEVSKALLPYHRCIFHGVAFVWQEKAYIFTAPSGTGKSTQFKNWKKLYRQDVYIINGDKPVLEFCNDKSIIVHPSPWNGKESFHGYKSAPLAGLIYLEQGKENKIERMAPQDAVIPLYKQFSFLPEKEEYIHAVCRMEDTLLRKIPVWKLINKGDLESAQLTHNVLLKYLEG